MICRVLGCFQGSHLKHAGFENLSKAAHCQEKEGGGDFLILVASISHFPWNCAPVQPLWDDKLKSHNTLLVLRLLYFSRLVMRR